LEVEHPQNSNRHTDATIHHFLSLSPEGGGEENSTMSRQGLEPQCAAKLIARLHLKAAGVLLLGPLATTWVLARFSRFPSIPFSPETGRSAAGWFLLVALLWIGGTIWIRRLAGGSPFDFREAGKAVVLVAVCSLATAAAIVSGVLFRWPLWAFSAWLVALGVRIGRGRPAYPQSLAAQRLMLVLGLFLVWWGFGALIAARQVDVLMAPTLGVLAILLGALLLAGATAMLLLISQPLRAAPLRKSD
jgi:hypothetical protein